MTAEVRALLRARDIAFRAGNKEALSTARATLARAIREAKRAHAPKIHGHSWDCRDTQQLWQGIQSITNYRTTTPACDSDASLPDALNVFHARFEAENDMGARKNMPPPGEQVLCLTKAEVRKILQRVNLHKAAGPDDIPGSVLKDVQTNWRTFSQTSLTSPWVVPPSHHALKPPPLSLCPKSHLCPTSTTTTPSHSPLPSWSALTDWSWGT